MPGHGPAVTVTVTDNLTLAPGPRPPQAEAANLKQASTRSGPPAAHSVTGNRRPAGRAAGGRRRSRWQEFNRDRDHMMPVI